MHIDALTLISLTGLFAAPTLIFLLPNDSAENFERPGKGDRRKRLAKSKRRGKHELKVLFGRRDTLGC